MPHILSIPYRADSESYFSRLRHLPYACWLDSGKPGDHGRYDIISALPATRLLSKAGQTSLYHTVNAEQQRVDVTTDNPFTQLKAQLAQLEQHTSDTLPFYGGAIGYCSYTMATPAKQWATSSGFADMAMGIYHWALVQDHDQQCAWLASLANCDATTLNTVKHCLAAPETAQVDDDFRLLSLQADTSREHYVQTIAKLKAYIYAGDCYQVNFAHRFHGRYQGNPYYAYQALRHALASPYSAYLQLGDHQAILSLSPERFLKVTQTQVLAEPIKGTRPRQQDPASDKNSASRLQNSPKDCAENLMIVDLMRNDLGKHCVPGSIAVPRLFGIESFPNVHHLVSHVTGRLQPNRDSVDLLQDSFPGGSITGAPKRRAMEIIAELESSPREVYCGSILYINPNGDMDSNIAIRTVMCDQQQLSCWGGGGIIADSDPEAEYQESLNKINLILDTLRGL
ncbi:MAG: aminodeoxychorismate synthase component I [Cellvibrionaceae bacterium]|nr:aminodeoxychorismate synthase component I [Cellvibrionaceae bacterium]